MKTFSTRQSSVEGLSNYIDVHTKKEIMAMSPEEYAKYKTAVAMAKRLIPFGNRAAWDKLSTITEWFKEIDKKRSSAKEELTAESSQEDFIEELAKVSSKFIRDNREAFDIDDRKAVEEFVAVFTAEPVIASIFNFLQNPPEEPVVEKETEEIKVEAEKPAQPAQPAEGNPEMVSADVMALLDEE